MPKNKFESAQQYQYRTEKSSGSRSYGIYTALISKPTIGAIPTVIVLENTIGPIDWSDGGTGVTYGTLSGAFPENKTILNGPIIISNSNRTFITRVSNDQVKINSYSGTYSANVLSDNNILSGSLIEIRVYN